MGIETAPIEWDYGNNCGCFTAGYTPRILSAYIAGVMIGNTWVPANGPGPNGPYTLTQSGIACLWSQAAPIGSHIFHTNKPGTSFTAQGPLGVNFYASDAGNCKFYLPNDQQLPNAPFYGGAVIIFSREPSTGNCPGLADVLDLINMDGRASRKSEGFPLDSSHLVAMFADQVESTRIRIKYDFS